MFANKTKLGALSLVPRFKGTSGVGTVLAEIKFSARPPQVERL
jgi:hypothetical protein